MVGKKGDERIFFGLIRIQQKEGKKGDTVHKSNSNIRESGVVILNAYLDMYLTFQPGS